MGILKRRTAVVLAAVAVVAVVAAGVAFAVGGDRGEREQAMLADVATSLGVEQETLEQAIRDAQTSRVDAAEDDGTLSDEQADRIRERIDTGQAPLLAAPGRRGHHRGGRCKGFGKRAALEAAAGALGVAASELKGLLPGSSIEAIAEDKSVAVSDVTDAIVTAWEARIDQAVADEKITQERATALKDALSDRASSLVERTFPEKGARGFGKRGFGKHGNRDWGDKNNNSPVTSTADPA